RESGRRAIALVERDEPLPDVKLHDALLTACAAERRQVERKPGSDLRELVACAVPRFDGRAEPPVERLHLCEDSTLLRALLRQLFLRRRRGEVTNGNGRDERGRESHGYPPERGHRRRRASPRTTLDLP